MTTSQYMKCYPGNARLREHCVFRASDGRLRGAERLHRDTLVLEAGVVVVYRGLWVLRRAVLGRERLLGDAPPVREGEFGGRA